MKNKSRTYNEIFKVRDNYKKKCEELVIFYNLAGFKAMLFLS